MKMSIRVVPLGKPLPNLNLRKLSFTGANTLELGVAAVLHHIAPRTQSTS